MCITCLVCFDASRDPIPPPFGYGSRSAQTNPLPAPEMEAFQRKTHLPELLAPVPHAHVPFSFLSSLLLWQPLWFLCVWRSWHDPVCEYSGTIQPSLVC